jgi:hypothetical protein
MKAAKGRNAVELLAELLAEPLVEPLAHRNVDVLNYISTH